MKRSYFIGQKSKVDFSLVAARRTETRKGRAGQTSVTETATCQCPLRCRCFNSRPVRRRKVTSETTETVSEKQLRTNFAASRQTSSAARQAAWLHTAPPQSVHAQSSSGLDPSVTDRGHFFSLLSWCFPSTETMQGRGNPGRPPRLSLTQFLNCSDRASCHGMAMTDQWQNSNRLFHY